MLAVVGPTAVGKSALALRLAPLVNGEIVGADSRQVYRYMDVGTAKPSAEERAQVVHHVLDVVEPDEEFSLALYLRRARAAIREIEARGRVPILVGGTGQYVRALLDGWNVPEVPPDATLREEMEARVERDGAEALHRELADIDPEAAARIDPRNPRRVVRRLEVLRSPHAATGPGEQQPLDAVVVGLTLNRADLYGRIDARVDDMMSRGWLAEVEGLLARGYGAGLPSMSGHGYRELAAHLAGDWPLEEAVEETKRRVRRFPGQQYAWFRLDDERIRWFDAAGQLDAAAAYALNAAGA